MMIVFSEESFCHYNDSFALSITFYFTYHLFIWMYYTNANAI